ncbi:cobalamin-binding protein [Massilia sp. DWR3-1-1]|uniref:cobalamin-binding protein n=1 Tax=Massilia sp. DWR3-1-1 TaxID=2804559 RepID=UPI003CEAE35F
MIFKGALAGLMLTALTAAPAGAAVSVVDDAGHRVTLAAPARRVIAMAPHITELLFAAGGGAQVVGAINYSDYPPAASQVPLVGSDERIDLERLIALKPDLLVVWQSGNTARQLAQLQQLGIALFFSEPRTLEQVATSVERLGALLGTTAQAAPAAARYRASIAALKAQYGARPPVRVFYQVWDQPLYTLSDRHIIGDAIRLCGGVNVFGGLKVVAPSVGIEAVLQENPEAIFGSEAHDAADLGIGMWQPYRRLLAVERGNLFRLDGVLLTRPGPRLALGAAQLCQKIELARQRRTAPPNQ